MPELNYEKKNLLVFLFMRFWKTQESKGWKILLEMWHKHAVISICERCIVMYNPRLDQRTTQLFTPLLISLDTRQVSHLPLFVSFSLVYSLSFYLLELFHMPSRKRYLNRRFNDNCGVDSPPPTPPPTPRLPACTDNRFQNQKFGNPLSLLSTSIFPPWTSTNHPRRG